MSSEELDLLQTMRGFEREEELDLPYTDIRESKVFSVFRREGEKSWNSVLYMREYLLGFEEKIMSQFWENKEKTRLYVRGPPGCGKTCFFLLWARLRSIKEKQRVLIVQFREKDASYIWIRKRDGTLWHLKKAIDSKDLRDEVKGIIQDNENSSTPFDLCIHHGVLDRKEICSAMLSTLNTAVTNGILKKVVHVTSLAFSLSTGGQRLDEGGPILRLSIDSWRLQDYHEAVKEFTNLMIVERTTLSKDKITLENNRDDGDGEKNSLDAVGEGEMTGAGDEMMDVEGSGDGDTADDASWTDVIETKYYYAGGSARFMFDFKLSGLRKELDDRCDNVNDEHWKYFAIGTVTSGTPVAVSHLMQQFDKKASPVSKYILFKAYEKCKTQLVNAVKAAAQRSNNPALKGWAFELAQIDLIRLSLESPPANPEYITNNAGLSFRPTAQIDFDEKNLLEWGIQNDGTIIWCLKWNQGCFDVAFYRDLTLITLQFTVSEEHSLKPRFIRRLRDALKEKGVEVSKFVHVAIGEVEQFQFKMDTSGTGRQGNAKDPQFVIDAYHSPPLEQKTFKPVGSVVFQAEFPPTLKKATIDMWELATTKKRRMNQ